MPKSCRELFTRKKRDVSPNNNGQGCIRPADDHECPYDADINGNRNSSCNCCAECTQECANDI